MSDMVCGEHSFYKAPSDAISLAHAWLSAPNSFWGTTSDELSEVVNSEEVAFAEHDLRGKIVALPLANDPLAVCRMISVLAAGSSPLVLPADAPPLEVLRLAQIVGASAIVDDDGIKLLPSTSVTTSVPAIFLSTSGSTGEAKVVCRNMESWIAEAQRYLTLLSPVLDDHVVIAVPVAHAYAMGWLWTCMIGGLTVELQPPSALGAVATGMRHRATHTVLTPTIAGLLAARRTQHGEKAGSDRLRVAMAGAGAVSPKLSKNFLVAFGIPLSTNYGSTETGALLASLEPLADGATGLPMPGLAARLSDSGTLMVTDETGYEHNTGDLAERMPDGSYRILGRSGEAIRRGDKWISPNEVADVLSTAPGVTDVFVRAAGTAAGGNQRLIATVVGKGRTPISAAEVIAFGAKQLSPAKRPDVLEVAPDIPRNNTGKPLRRIRRRLATPEILAEAARAYKRSSLVFTLYDTGLYDKLVEGSTADEAAIACGLMPDAVERLFNIAQKCGLLEPAEEEQGSSQVSWASDVLALERLLYNEILTPLEITEVLRKGLLKRPFANAQEPSIVLRTRYAAAMDGPHRQVGRALALRAFRQRPSVRNILEIGASAGRYVAAVLHSSPSASGVLLRVGRLAPELAPEAQALVDAGRLELRDAPDSITGGIEALTRGQTFDLVVCDNSVHGPQPGGDLNALVASVAPKGALLIDDIFLPQGADAAIGLDWLTHGGWTNMEIDSVVRHLKQTGGIVRRLLDRANGLQSITLTTWPKRNNS